MAYVCPSGEEIFTRYAPVTAWGGTDTMNVAGQLAEAAPVTESRIAEVQSGTWTGPPSASFRPPAPP